MTVPLVSVKMITYNHAPFIAQAIEGVMQQKTNFPFELVIGEDCSTDATRQIVFDYQKRYPDIIRVITSDKNVGMKKNGLRTLNASRGKYVAFCEGDDYWHNSNKLQKQVEYLERYPECGLVYSSYDVYHVASKKLIKDFVALRRRRIPENLTIADIVEGTSGILTCTVMVRNDFCRQIIDADPYLHQSDDFLMGDTQLWAEFAARTRLHYIPESLATHTITAESASRSRQRVKVLQFGISGARCLLALCDKYDLPPEIRHKHQESLLNCTLELAFLKRDGELAETVRQKKMKFLLRDWLRYYGARNRAVHDMYLLSVFVANVFRKKHRQWR